MLMLKKKNKVHHGFTLIELIIVMTLTMVLMSMAVQGFFSSSAQFSFSNEAEKIQAMIRTARSLAISGKAQPDYTDFNNNQCLDAGNQLNDPGDCSEFVTPAHYGVVFIKNPDANEVAIFVDNHSKNALAEGYYADGENITGYRGGDDILLDTYFLPKGMQLIIPQIDGTTEPGADSGNTSSVLFSPIFADVSTDPKFPPSKPFFTFGITQKQGGIVRKRCWQIHLMAGVSEPMAIPDVPTGENVCP